jgi:polysaccharide biosynthesis/export protein
MHRHSYTRHRLIPWLGLSALTWSTISLPGLALVQPASPNGQPQPSLPNVQYQPCLGGSCQPTSSTSEASYTLGAGDRLRIDLFQAPQYSGEQEVQIDGTLNLPLVGKISVKGLTLEQTTAALSSAYARYLRRPTVTLSLLQRRPIQIGVAGEVNRPGTYTIPVNAESTQLPRVTQLLEAAGGITQIADLRQVQIRRLQPTGGQQVVTVDLWQLVQTGDLGYDTTLRDGDTIFVPETSVNLAEAPLLNSTSFSGDVNQPVNISIVGEVYRPGTYTVTGNTTRATEAGVPGSINNTAGGPPTVTRAIQVAGGIKPLANIRNVKIRRLTRAAGEQEFEVDLWSLLKDGDARQDAVLQPGDTIVIPAVSALDPTTASQLGTASFSPDKIQVNVVGEVVEPGVVQVAPNTPLNQAILAAGGFIRRSRRSNVQLIRLNEDGTVSRQKISIDLEQGLGDATNPALRDNDVIIVSANGWANFSDTIREIATPLSGLFSIFELPFRFLRLF